MGLVPFAQWHLRTRLPSLAPQAAAGVDPAAFLLTRRYLGSTAVFLNRNGEPALTYKLVAHESLNLFLENAVRCAHQARGHGFSTQTIYETGRVGGRAYAVYSWLPGTPLVHLKGGFAQDKDVLNAAAEAITELHTRTLQKGGPERAPLEKRVHWWRELLAAHPAMPPRLLETIDRILALLWKWLPQLRGVLMHGDCAGVNLLRDAQGNVNFIDWELGLTGGLPAIDLVTLLLNHPAFWPNEPGLGPILARCFLDGGPAADQCWHAVYAYAERLGLPEEALPVLVATTHIKMVAESRHYTVLHHGTWSRGSTAEDLEALDRILARCQGPASSTAAAGEGLGSEREWEKGPGRLPQVRAHAPCTPGDHRFGEGKLQRL
jgi:aminoglycoside phosphotransferase (APT) family kinase protein